MNSIACITWVKRGVAKSQPDKITVGEEDLKRLIQSHEQQLKRLRLDEAESDDGDEDENEAAEEAGGRKRRHKDDSESEDEPQENADIDVDEIAKRYGLDEYDDDWDEDEDDEEEENPMNIQNLMTYASNKDDPHLSKDKDDEDDDVEIIAGDNMIVVGKVSGDFCNLEIYVYNEDEDNMFCHHDLMIPTFPLALEWLDFDPGESSPSNLVAMGTMEPDIEIWDLDVMDAVEPSFVLAGAHKKKGKKKKKTASSGHTEAVLDISWNHIQRNVLASASADFTVGLWDLEKGSMVTAITHHKEKVQAIQWHPFEAQSLLSGGFDHTVKVYDCRSPSDTLKSWTLSGEVERVAWNIHDPFYFLASTESGEVYNVDVRADKPVFTLKAHSGAVSGLSLSSQIPGCLVTTSADKFLKVWDIRNHKPSLVHDRNLKMGGLHAAGASPDSGLVFAVGGETELRVINLKKNPYVSKHFGLACAGSVDEGGDELAAAGMEPGEEEEEEQEEGKVMEAAAEPKKKKKKKKKQQQQS